MHMQFIKNQKSYFTSSVLLLTLALSLSLTSCAPKLDKVSAPSQKLVVTRTGIQPFAANSMGSVYNEDSALFSFFHWPSDADIEKLKEYDPSLSDFTSVVSSVAESGTIYDEITRNYRQLQKDYDVEKFKLVTDPQNKEMAAVFKMYPFPEGGPEATAQYPKACTDLRDRARWNSVSSFNKCKSDIQVVKDKYRHIEESEASLIALREAVEKYSHKMDTETGDLIVKIIKTVEPNAALGETRYKNYFPIKTDKSFKLSFQADPTATDGRRPVINFILKSFTDREDADANPITFTTEGEDPDILAARLENGRMGPMLHMTILEKVVKTTQVERENEDGTISVVNEYTFVRTGNRFKATLKIARPFYGMVAVGEFDKVDASGAPVGRGGMMKVIFEKNSLL